MIFLTTATDSIRIVTSSSAAIDVHASWIDMPSPLLAGSARTPGRQNTDIVTATTTTVVPAPAASVVRDVCTLTVRNTDATASNSIQILHTTSSGTATLW